MSSRPLYLLLCFFFFNDTATTEIYTLSLHDALPISPWRMTTSRSQTARTTERSWRSEEHTSELQSHVNLVCRLLLEKKKKMTNNLDNDEKGDKQTLVQLVPLTN